MSLTHHDAATVAGLDLDTLSMMLEAVSDFVTNALPPERILQLDHEDVCPEDTVRALQWSLNLMELMGMVGAYAPSELPDPWRS